MVVQILAKLFLIGTVYKNKINYLFVLKIHIRICNVEMVLLMH
jgi:hypothetical protein